MSILPQELRFTGDCLAAEPKNYHVWAHRQAVLLAANTAAGASAGGNSGGDGGDDCSASADAAAPHDGSDAVQPAAAAASAALDVAGEGTAPARPADGGEPGPSSGRAGAVPAAHPGGRAQQQRLGPALLRAGTLVLAVLSRSPANVCLQCTSLHSRSASAGMTQHNSCMCDYAAACRRLSSCPHYIVTSCSMQGYPGCLKFRCINGVSLFLAPPRCWVQSLVRLRQGRQRRRRRPHIRRGRRPGSALRHDAAAAGG